MLADAGQVTAGTPLVAGAKVTAQVVEQGRGPKKVIFKYKSKTRYRKRTGHRQPFTRLAIEQIVAPGMEEAAPKRKRRAKAETKEEESEG